MFAKYLGTTICLTVVALSGCSGQKQDAPANADNGLIRLQPDEILISIDGNDLTYGQAVRQVELRLGGPPPQGMDPEQVALIERRTFATIVDDFIRRELLLTEARRLGIEPAEENIATALRELETRSKDQGTPPSGMFYEGTDSLRREVIAGLTIEKLLANVLPPFQLPSQAQIEAYLENFPNLRTMPARARARHIFLGLAPNADPAASDRIKTNLEDTRKRLLDGADFGQTANMISQDGTAARGGDLGVIIKDRGDPAFDRAIFSQPVGEIGPIVQTSAGLHIIQVLEREDAREATADDIISVMRRNHRAEALAEYIQSLRKHIEIRHSPAIKPIPPTP